MTNKNEAFDVAMRAARAPPEARPTMTDFFSASARTLNGKPFYRPWEAAARWVESDRKAVLKYKQGVTLADPTTVAAALRSQQLEEDAKAGLGGETATSSSLPFAGVAR